MATAVQLCVSWMVSNIGTSQSDDVLKTPAPGRTKSAARPLRQKRNTADRAAVVEHDRGEDDDIEVVLVDRVYPDERRSSQRYGMQMTVELRGEQDAAR